jgi:predicted GIY-YIG superfamily endonuclease
MSIYSNITYVYWLHLPEHTDPYTQGYIGVSKNPKQRLWEHRNDAKTGNHCNPHLARILQKYADQLVQTIVFEDENSVCYAYEEVLRPAKNIGWNLNKGGDCPPSNKGKKFSVKHCANISKGKLGGIRPPVTAETRQKMSLANTGRMLSNATKQKIKDKRKNQVFSEETKKKLSVSHQGNIPGNARAVKTPLGTYTSVKKASQAHNIAHQTMLNWLNASKPGFEFMAPTS